jgi:hypothetical protein
VKETRAASLVQGDLGAVGVVWADSYHLMSASGRVTKFVRSANERTYIEQYGNARLPIWR